MKRLTVPIRGMHCSSCEIVVGDKLEAIPGVVNAVVSRRDGSATIDYDGSEPEYKLIVRAVRDAGYEIGDNGRVPWISKNLADYLNLVGAFAILLALWAIFKSFDLANLNTDLKPSGLAVALLVGLIAGVSTCMALVGGLVLSFSARHAELHPEATALQKFRPHLYFNGGRIIGYAIFGGVIGLVGRVVQFSPGVLGFMTLVIGGVMIFLGLKLVEIFPALKNKTISLPSRVGKIFGLKNDRREYSPWAAAVTGSLTFFLPCGFTQAMQLYAVSTGSFYRGAAIMGLFALGTAPGLIGIGGISSIFKGRVGRLFFAVAGLAVLAVGWTNLANGWRTLAASIKTTAPAGQNIVNDNETQIVNMTQNGGGYSPNSFTVVAGRPVKWIINSTSPYTCASTIMMPAFGINKTLEAGENTITFTPTAAGTIPFTCSMGMYRGQFIVVNGADGGHNGAKNIVPAWGDR